MEDEAMKQDVIIIGGSYSGMRVNWHWKRKMGIVSEEFSSLCAPTRGIVARQLDMSTSVAAPMAARHPWFHPRDRPLAEPVSPLQDPIFDPPPEPIRLIAPAGR